MRLFLGGNLFNDVTIPVLWGKRAILEDKQRRLSVIDLSGLKARIEILGDKVARGIRYTITTDGYAVLTDDGRALYSYSARDKRLTADSLDLPELQITGNQIRVGTNIFQADIVSGFGVGVAISEHGVALGAPLPSDLAALVVEA